MNQTEAWETVWQAAALWEAAHPGGKVHVFSGDDHDAEYPLLKALMKTGPKVYRMRSRLDHQRARRAGKPKCPKWAEP